jgi:choline dehydrogenase
VLANRLTENPKNCVLLIDGRGGDSWWNSKIHMPTAPAYPLGRREINWSYELEPDHNMNNCPLYWPRKNYWVVQALSMEWLMCVGVWTPL